MMPPFRDDGFVVVQFNGMFEVEFVIDNKVAEDDNDDDDDDDVDPIIGDDIEFVTTVKAEDLAK